MKDLWTPERLVAFEDRVAEAFKDKKIHAPVHLSGGNEKELIEIFKQIKPTDWVFSNWRSHYHALLHGIPEEYVFNEILAGRSMYLSSKEHNFLSGSIVAGMCPIACGVALGIKKNEGTEKVHIFVGEMAARTGQFFEMLQYADCNDLPLRVIIEDNGLSTDTPTDKAWGESNLWWKYGLWLNRRVEIVRYIYQRTRPHVGIGEHVAF